jgi:hypothetical protein
VKEVYETEKNIKSTGRVFQYSNAYSAGISGGSAAECTGQPWFCYGGVPDTSDSRWKWEIYFKKQRFLLPE